MCKQRYSPFFYIVYSLDEYGLPIGIYNSSDELGAFFNKTGNQIRIIFCKRKSKKVDPIVRKRSNKTKYLVTKWRELKNGDCIRQI